MVTRPSGFTTDEDLESPLLLGKPAEPVAHTETAFSAWREDRDADQSVEDAAMAAARQDAKTKCAALAARQLRACYSGQPAPPLLTPCVVSAPSARSPQSCSW